MCDMISQFWRLIRRRPSILMLCCFKIVARRVGARMDQYNNFY